MGGENDRLQKLQAMLEKQPNDVFLLYAVALEHKKNHDLERAAEFLDRTIAVDPNYCYAYYQRAQVCEMQGDLESARRWYRQGIEAANRAGDAHAREELSAALSLLE